MEGLGVWGLELQKGVAGLGLAEQWAQVFAGGVGAGHDGGEGG